MPSTLAPREHPLKEGLLKISKLIEFLSEYRDLDIDLEIEVPAADGSGDWNVTCVRGLRVESGPDGDTERVVILT